MSVRVAASPRLVIAHLTQTWLPQTQIWMYSQLSHLPVAVESHVVCRTMANTAEFQVPNTHCLTSSLPHRLSNWVLCRVGHAWSYEIGQVRRCGARVIHSHFGNAGWSHLPVARATGTKHIVTFYGADVSLSDRDPCWHDRYQQLFEAVDRVLCEGPHMARRITAMGCSLAKVRVHHLGVDLGAVPFRPRRWAVGEPLKVLLAATFTEKKGFCYAVAALARLVPEVDLRLTIIGDARASPADESEKRQILGALTLSGLMARTRLLGYQPYSVLLEESYNHHIFLSPSVTAKTGDTEGGAPMALIDMAASGMPIVSTKHCDIPNVILDGVTGLLAAERDVDGLTQHMRTLIRMRNGWLPMLTASRRRVEDEFDATRQGVRLAAFYNELAESPRCA